MSDINKRLDELRDLILQSSVPVEHQLWDIKRIAAHYGVSKRQAERIAYAPGFPKPIREQFADGSRSHPRWRAKDVLQHQNRRAA
ncbi:MAG: hypothetical protein NXI11_03110 [Proteobacteria bacterium]|nr:hypothetical protein [Pseudomonadota bacterium]